MAEKKPKQPRTAKGIRRRRKLVRVSTGLAAGELQAAALPGAVAELHQQIETDGGRVLSVYSEPYGGQWLVLAALPIELVEPTPYQRDISDTHVRKLKGVIGKIGRFLDPIIAVRIPKPDHVAKYWTLNYFLTAPISWTPNRGQERYKAVTVPKGFVTDFSSTPRVFWIELRPDGQYTYAAVVHDYLYWTQVCSRDEVDDISKMAMADFEVRTLTSGVIYKAVRVGGKIEWNGNAEKKVQGEKRILTRFPQDPRTRWEDWKQRPGVFDP